MVNSMAAVPAGVRPADADPPELAPPPPTDPERSGRLPPPKLTAFPDASPPSAPAAEFCAADSPPFAVTVIGPDGPGPNIVGCPLTGVAPWVPPSPTAYGITWPDTHGEHRLGAYSAPPPPPPTPVPVRPAPAPPPPTPSTLR